MPIRNLTDRPAQFPRIGELRKGAPKDPSGKRPGADLTYFRFTPTDPKDTGLAQLFVTTIGEKPQLLYVLLPEKTPEENLDAWQEEWTAGSLKHRCDGQTVVLELAEGGKVYRINPGTPCPGGCKAAGRLGVILPQLKRAGIVSVLTTSKNDLLNLSRSLAAAYQLRGDLRGIPFALSRVPRMISTPAENGKRARREKWLLNLEIAPQWFERQLAELQVNALPQAVNAPLLLEGYDEPDEEDEPAGTDRPLADGSSIEEPPDSGLTTMTTTSMKSDTTTSTRSQTDTDGQLVYYDQLFADAMAQGIKPLFPLSAKLRLSPNDVAGAIKNLETKLAGKKG